MKILGVIALISLPLLSTASSTEERAFLLNQEMEYLMSTASTPKVWGKGSLLPRNQRSGPAPSQIEGIENLEERFFSDEVRFQSARSIEPEEAPQSESNSKNRRLRARDDGTIQAD
jgi:hypothetical protein